MGRGKEHRPQAQEGGCLPCSQLHLALRPLPATLSPWLSRLQQPPGGPLGTPLPRSQRPGHTAPPVLHHAGLRAADSVTWACAKAKALGQGGLWGVVRPGCGRRLQPDHWPERRLLGILHLNLDPHTSPLPFSEEETHRVPPSRLCLCTWGSGESLLWRKQNPPSRKSCP